MVTRNDALIAFLVTPTSKKRFAFLTPQPSLSEKQYYDATFFG